MQSQPSVVTREILKRGLEQARAGAAGEREGLFGPESVSWRVNREAAVFLCAGRAALLQMAHPWVARALEEHSTTLSDPVRRFHNTFRVVYRMVFGTLSDAMEAARSLHALHTGIVGRMSEAAGPFAAGSAYQANEAGALCWVFATLVESAGLAYDLVLPPLSMDERERYYAESLRFAALFGLAREQMPADWRSLMAYIEEMIASDALRVSGSARVMGQAILTGAGSRVHPPLWYRALTAEMLPPRLRIEFALPWGERERRAALRAHRWLPRIYPRLPRAVRFVGPCREAEARLQGRQPGLAARLSTRFWTGI